MVSVALSGKTGARRERRSAVRPPRRSSGGPGGRRGKLFIVAAGAPVSSTPAGRSSRRWGRRRFFVGGTPRPRTSSSSAATSSSTTPRSRRSAGDGSSRRGRRSASISRFLTSARSSPRRSAKTYGALIAEQSSTLRGFCRAIGREGYHLTAAAANTLRVPMPLAGLLHDRFLTLSPMAAGARQSVIGQLAAGRRSRTGIPERSDRKGAMGSVAR